MKKRNLSWRNLLTFGLVIVLLLLSVVGLVAVFRDLPAVACVGYVALFGLCLLLSWQYRNLARAHRKLHETAVRNADDFDRITSAALSSCNRIHQRHFGSRIAEASTNKDKIDAIVSLASKLARTLLEALEENAELQATVDQLQNAEQPAESDSEAANDVAQLQADVARLQKLQALTAINLQDWQEGFEHAVELIEELMTEAESSSVDSQQLAQALESLERMRRAIRHAQSDQTDSHESDEDSDESGT